MIIRHLKKFTILSSNRKLSKYAYQNFIDIHPEVKSALENHKPIVALESTIITHGMPYPQSLETAIEVENVVRTVGAIPATIACIDGRLKVGLSIENMIHLAKLEGDEVIKSSRRDLPYVISNAKCGGTTVAATMIIAHIAGIKIFATGGIGGVHRDGHITMDVSADLIELGRTPVTVVSSGVKSILDIPRTLEYLETQGVCVATFKNEECNFPDFYTRDSGCKAPFNLQNLEQAANLVKALHQLELQSGILIAVPIPHEYAADKAIIDAAINQAYKDAIKTGVKGKEVTPFLLAAIAKITDGISLAANIALIKNNAKIAAQISSMLCKADFSTTESINDTKSAPGKPLIIGASILDLCLTIKNDVSLTLNGATHHVYSKESAGGVGRNLAEAICKLYGAANFVSAVGKDYIGQRLLQFIPEPARSGVLVDDENATSICSVLFDNCGDCKICLANMEIHASITPQIIKDQEQLFKTTPLVVIDGNLNSNTMKTILELSFQYNKPVLFEPTDMLIAGKPFELDRPLTKPIRIITPNIFEFKTIVETITGKTIIWDLTSILSSPDLLLSKNMILLKLIENKFDCIIVTLEVHGVLVHLRGESFEQQMFDQTGAYINNKKSRFITRFYTAPTVENIVNVSGAGDSFSSGFIAGLLRGLSINESIAFGFLAAERSLQSNSAVPEQYFKNRTEEMELLNNLNNSLKFKDIY